MEKMDDSMDIGEMDDSMDMEEMDDMSDDKLDNFSKENLKYGVGIDYENISERNFNKNGISDSFSKIGGEVYIDYKNLLGFYGLFGQVSGYEYEESTSRFNKVIKNQIFY